MRSILTLAVAGALLHPLAGSAADAPATVSAKAGARPAAKPATSHQQLRNQAKGLALATETVQRITDVQLAVAERVLTGDVACEFDQTVSVNRIADRPGHFQVGYKKVVYTMVPEETTTGAVRLEDKKAGVMWLQIPMKSMLMNAKIGQRMVDACLHAEQRAAVTAAAANPAPTILQNADQATAAPTASAAPTATVAPAAPVAPTAPVAAAEVATPIAADTSAAGPTPAKN